MSARVKRGLSIEEALTELETLRGFGSDLIVSVSIHVEINPELVRS